MNKINQWKKKIYFANTMYKTFTRFWGIENIDKFLWFYLMELYYSKKLLAVEIKRKERKK